MCKAFSGIVDFNGKVTWQFGVDSHSKLAEIGGYSDKQLGEFAKFEITPSNNNYLYPDYWVYRLVESSAPNWCGIHEKELALAAHKEWLVQLDAVLIRKPIVNPFDIPAPEITPEIIALLKQWALVRNSVGESVGESVWDSVGNSVLNPVLDSIWDSVLNSELDSIWDSVWAYVGSFFNLPEWADVYPFQSAVDLWNLGLIPSFDGKTWRLHGGENGGILYESRLV